ncbi:MAG: hypothetical protein U0869_07455 [Chloroflexota bacterium]
MSWWGGKVRQVRAYLGARVSGPEREALAARLTPAQLALFDSMHVADQRHGLAVMGDIRRVIGERDPELLLAALFHDAAKGPETGLVHRVTWSLGERYGAQAWEVARVLPGFAPALERMRDHAQASADLALAAGCTPRTAALIRAQSHPVEEAGRLLLVADEAN